VGEEVENERLESRLDLGFAPIPLLHRNGHARGFAAAARVTFRCNRRITPATGRFGAPG